jgi:DNA invertase Pin-like site-specific DNA recombinase
MATSSMRKRSFVKDGKSANGSVLLGYARVSKGDEQNNVLQAKVLRVAGCRRLFEEVASGGRWDRPELHRMLDHLREGDTVVVWKLDRLSRSLKDVLHIMERIAQAGAGFQSITENHNSGRPHDDADDRLVRRLCGVRGYAESQGAGGTNSGVDH